MLLGVCVLHRNGLITMSDKIGDSGLPCLTPQGRGPFNNHGEESKVYKIHNNFAKQGRESICL